MHKKQKKFKNGQASTRSEELVKPASIHPYLRFGSGSKEYEERLNELIKKPFDASWVVDWDPLEETGIEAHLKKCMLTQEYSPDGEKTYRYEDWHKLLYKDQQCIYERIYQELCWEFHSTYILNENPLSMKDNDFMRFRLGGKAWKMSLKEFTKCLKIYSVEQMREPHFSKYIWTGARVSSAINPNMNKEEEGEFNPNKVWKTFSSVSSWSPDGVSFLYMDNRDFRLIHLFLTRTIFHRTKDMDKVSLSDLWYLKHFHYSKRTHVNIPYCVAYYLKHWATGGVDPNSPICGGHFITLIAHHLRVDCRENMGIKKLSLKTNTICYVLYHVAKAITMHSGKFHVMGGLGPAQEPQFIYEEPPEEEEEEEEEDDDDPQKVVMQIVKQDKTLKEMFKELQCSQIKYHHQLSLLLASVGLQAMI